MKKTLLTAFTLSLIALLISGCAGTGVSSEIVRTINVNGKGEIRLAPDIARVNIGVRSQSREIAEAFEENNAAAEAILSKMESMGVDRSDLRTSNFSVYAQQDYPRPITEDIEDEVPEMQTTYVVENSVSVTVRDLDTLGDILSAVVAEGANTIYGVTFDIADPSAAREEARQIAISNAREQAEAIAGDAGVKLGDLHAISISEGEPVTIERAAAMEMAQGGGGVPIESGNLTIIVTANLSFQID